MTQRPASNQRPWSYWRRLFIVAGYVWVACWAGFWLDLSILGAVLP